VESVLSFRTHGIFLVSKMDFYFFVYGVVMFTMPLFYMSLMSEFVGCCFSYDQVESKFASGCFFPFKNVISNFKFLLHGNLKPALLSMVDPHVILFKAPLLSKQFSF